MLYCYYIILLCLRYTDVWLISVLFSYVQWWQKESGPSAVISKKEQTRVKRPNKSRKTVNLYMKYNKY